MGRSRAWRTKSTRKRRNRWDKKKRVGAKQWCLLARKLRAGGWRQVVRKGDDAKAHKELNALGGDGGGEKEMDTAKAQAAMSQLESAAAAEKAARLERERELAKVKIDSKDVKLIMEGEYPVRLN